MRERCDEIFTVEKIVDVGYDREEALQLQSEIKTFTLVHTKDLNQSPAAAFQADEFPAFFSPSSGIRALVRVESAEEVAMAYLSSLELGLKNGMLIGVPNNHPAGASVEDAIQGVLKEAEKLDISGRDMTLFILKRVSEKTKGDSLKSNTALVKGNANVGADIAVAITKHDQEGKATKIYFHLQKLNSGMSQL